MSGLTPELPVHVVLVPPTVVSSVVVGSVVVGSVVVGSAVAGSAVVDSAAASSSGAGTDGHVNRIAFAISGLPSEVSSSPAVVVTKKLRILLVPATALSSRRLILLSFFAAPEAYNLSADVYPTDLHHNEVEQDTF